MTDAVIVAAARTPIGTARKGTLLDVSAFDISITVGYNTAQSAGLTREDCDAWAARSHHRAVQAIDEGRFQEEIVPIEVTLRDGTTKIFDTDEHPRRDSSMEKLAALKPLH